MRTPKISQYMASHPESMLVLLDEIHDGRKSSCTAAWETFPPRGM